MPTIPQELGSVFRHLVIPKWRERVALGPGICFPERKSDRKVTGPF
jgi:hypothetical protein